MKTPCLAALAVFAACSLHAQTEAPFFPTPGYFRQMFTPRQEYKLELPGSLRDLVKDGRLQINIADVTRLVVARNTDVWLARLDVESAETPLMRAFSGFDPNFTSSFSSNFASSPTFSQLQSSKSLNQNTQVGIQQLLPTGPTYPPSF